MAQRSKWLLLLLPILLCELPIEGPTVLAQSVRTPDTAIGNAPLAAYDVSGLDNVNTTNGNLYLDLPLLSYPQRGKDLRLTFRIYYNDKSWYIIWLSPSQIDPGAPPSGVWLPLNGQGVYIARDQAVSTGIDNTETVSSEEGVWGSTTATTYYYSGYVVTPDGSPHYIWDQVWQNCRTSGDPEGTGCPQTYGVYSASYPATDASGFIGRQFASNSDWQITDRHGVTYTSDGKIADVNGNVIQETSSGWTDTVGRFIPGTNSGPGAVSVSFTTGSAGGVQTLPQFTDLVAGVQTSDLSHCPTGTNAARIWTVPASGSSTVDYYLCYSNVSYQTNFNITQSSGWPFNVSEKSGTAQLLTAIVLPNSTSYTFTYDSFLSLAHLGLPSGGSIDYTWQTNRAYSWYGQYANPVNRAIATRTINPGNGWPSQTWTYHWTYEASGSPELGWSIVTDPYGNDTEHQLTGSSASVAEQARYFYEGCGPHDQVPNRTCSTSPSLLLKSETYTLSPNASGGSSSNTAAWAAATYPSFDHVATVTSYPTSGGTISSQVTTVKTPGYSTCSQMDLEAAQWNGSTPPTYTTVTPCYFTNQDKTISQYDYGAGSPGSLLYSTTTSYAWQNSPAYLAANLLELPSSIVTKDGSNNWAAETDFLYDENNGSPQGALGNLTSTTKVNNIGPSVKLQGVYDNSGQLTNFYDGNQGETIVTYMCGDSLTNTVKNPLGQTSDYTFDCNTGLLTEYQDPNNVTANVGTTYVYDSVRNPTLITRADHGTTTINYNGYAYPLTVEKIVAASPDPSIVTSTVYDGFLHPTQHVNGDGSTVETTYDLMYRTQSVTNPHFASSPSPTADGTTVYSYDPLGRPTVLTNPDFSTEQWCYLGIATAGQTNCEANVSPYAASAWVDHSDESGNRWQQISDAVGRLISVVEPAPNAELSPTSTTYSYDSLGNLIEIYEIGRPGTTPAGFPSSYHEQTEHRQFRYDSLSRLITSNNNETGKICYGQWANENCTGGYDANDNLLYKTDADGTILQYTYDALNRMTTKTSPQDFNTNYQYTYDQGANGIGRLYQEINPFVTGEIYGGTQFTYDAMGRVASTNWWDYDGQMSGGTTWRPGVAALYDLAGDLTQLTYPDSSIISQTWDASGRLAGVYTGPLTSLGAPYISAIQYSPSGTMVAATYGNGVTASSTLNDRLQPCHESATTPLLPPSATGGNLLDRQLFYGQTAETNCQNAANNNGNIWSILESPNHGTYQSFGYDALNRLTSAFSGNRSASSSYNFLYNYDSFGNMIPVDQLHTPMNYGIDATTNRMTLNGDVNTGDLQYYANGNLRQAPSAIGPDHTLGYTAEGYLRSIDNFQTGSYLTNGLGERVLVDRNVNQVRDEYVNFNGQPIATWSRPNMPGTAYYWTDLIYANGQKIARVQSIDAHLHVEGSPAGTGTYQWYLTGLLTGYVIQPGDRIALRQYQKGQAKGGIAIDTASTSTVWNEKDQTGDYLNSSTQYNKWELRTVDISRLAGQAITDLVVGMDSGSSGPGSVDVADISIVSSDGNVHTAFNGQDVALTFCSRCGGGMTDGTASYIGTADPAESATSTYYYLADQLGTTQMELSSSGWPVWQGWFTPFGQEIINGGEQNVFGQVTQDGTNMHYKFTGKERDSESGLDYFGARYYASNVGRWISADWAQKPEAVPYSKLDDPQSLNLYEYVGNNPLSRADADGHCDLCYAWIAPVAGYLATHPDIGKAFDKFTNSAAVKLSAGVGRKVEINGVKLGAAATVTSETKLDGTGKTGIQVTGAASVNGVGPQVNVNGTFENNGTFQNPLSNLSANAKLTDSTRMNDVTNTAAAIGTDGKASVGVGANLGVAQAGVQVSAGTAETKGVLSSVGDAIMQDVRQVVRDVRESMTCSAGGCAHQ